MNDWETVSKKSKKIVPHIIRERLTKEFVIKSLSESEFIKKQKLKGLFIYGSTAYDQNTENSDLDIAIVFDHKTCSAYAVKSFMEKLFNRHVDVACFFLRNTTKSYICPFQYETTMAFISNVIGDAVPVIGDKDILLSCDFLKTITA